MVNSPPLATPLRRQPKHQRSQQRVEQVRRRYLGKDCGGQFLERDRIQLT